MSGRGRYAKGVEKRAEILRTALDVFAREGYRGTTLREVAERCELSVAGVMHYFDSREDLLTQVILARDDDTALEPA
ncbi:TetR/AcrR family transcriptional regulator, partial [Isoptericola cucumis]